MRKEPLRSSFPFRTRCTFPPEMQLTASCSTDIMFFTSQSAHVSAVVESDSWINRQDHSYWLEHLQTEAGPRLSTPLLLCILAACTRPDSKRHERSALLERVLDQEVQTSLAFQLSKPILQPFSKPRKE